MEWNFDDHRDGDDDDRLYTLVTSDNCISNHSACIYGVLLEAMTSGDLSINQSLLLIILCRL